MNIDALTLDECHKYLNEYIVKCIPLINKIANNIEFEDGIPVDEWEIKVKYDSDEFCNTQLIIRNIIHSTINLKIHES